MPIKVYYKNKNKLTYIKVITKFEIPKKIENEFAFYLKNKTIISSSNIIKDEYLFI